MIVWWRKGTDVNAVAVCDYKLLLKAVSCSKRDEHCHLSHTRCDIFTCIDEAGAAEAGHGGLHELGGQGPSIGVQGFHPCQLSTVRAQLNLCHDTLVVWVQMPVAARQAAGQVLSWHCM